jgi:tetratricopeptide (TPR) repeat protein
VLLWRARRPGAAASAGPQRSPAIARPLVPELLLSVNHLNRIAVPAGTPLIFELLLRNGVAARASAAALARRTLQEDLDDEVRSGKLSRQQADARLQQQPVPAPIPSLLVNVGAESFAFSPDSAAASAAIPWRPQPANPAPATPATLDERLSVRATFVVAPDSTTSTAAATYRVRATFENHGAGQWLGTVRSNPVAITILAAPASATTQDRKTQQLELVEYYLAIKDYDRAITTARAVVALDPHTIDGSLLLGDAEQGKGDARAALDAYESGLAEFARQLPHDHPPRDVLRRVQLLREQLGAGLPDSVEGPAPPH